MCFKEFWDFVRCCFYVGKGTRNRKFTHLQELRRILILGLPKSSTKLRKMANIWGSGGNIAIIQIGQDSTNFEAASQEYAIIEAIGLQQLSNKNNATPYGAMKTIWNKNTIKIFGNSLLLNALDKAIIDMPQIFLKQDIYVPGLN